jgi:hypothetical protein
MKTTLNFPDRLIHEAKRRALDEGKTLTDLVVQGLEARIGSGGREGSLPVSTARGGLQAGVTWEKLAESMDTGEAHR